jgi:co-chaperonin GroES (HSP10)
MIEVTADNQLKKLIIIGDRVLIKPKNAMDRTSSGLYLPPGVQEREQVQAGYVMKVGPGYPIPMPVENDEPWRETEEKVKYLPLQVKEGDLAMFLHKGAIEIEYSGQKYVIVPQSSILMLERAEDLFD